MVTQKTKATWFLWLKHHLVIVRVSKSLKETRITLTRDSQKLYNPRAHASPFLKGVSALLWASVWSPHKKGVSDIEKFLISVCNLQIIIYQWERAIFYSTDQLLPTWNVKFCSFFFFFVIDMQNDRSRWNILKITQVVFFLNPTPRLN